MEHTIKETPLYRIRVSGILLYIIAVSTEMDTVFKVTMDSTVSITRMKPFQGTYLTAL